MSQFEAVEAMQQKLVDDAKEQLSKTIATSSVTMENELEEFSRDDFQSILKSL